MEICIDRVQLMADWEALHRIPEVGFHEHRTSAYLRGRLEEMGFEVQSIGGTGLLAALRGAEPGRSVGLRADMDALEFPNADGSVTMLHACGHDAHCAMVLAAGGQAARLGVPRGTLYLLFQPAEETLLGAERVIADPAFPHLDALFGIHLRPASELPVGQAAAQLLHQASIQVTATFRGREAHGARPFLGINALSAAAAAIARVDALEMDTQLSWSAKATSADCYGNAHNIIPERCTVVFDLRARDNALGDRLLQAVQDCIGKGAAQVGCSTEVSVMRGYAAEYDPALSALCERAIAQTLGSAVPVLETLGSEDFHSYYQTARVPVAYIGLGAGLTPGLHSRDMCFDKSCMPGGAAILCRCAYLALEAGQ